MIQITEQKNLLDEDIITGYLKQMEAPEGYVYASDTKFHRLFGRDSVIMSLELLPWFPNYAKNTIITLSNLQRDNGQILHETIKEETMWNSVDSTPLFLILVAEYYKESKDLDFVRSIFPKVQKAVNWINTYGDPDLDLFLEYFENGVGLTHHCWKDSQDGMTNENKVIPVHPIAPAEVQGYQYKALTMISKIYEVLDLKEGAKVLRKRAKCLKKEFNQKYWMEDKQFFAIALDGKKEQVKTISSNIGHAVWSGIVDDDKISKVLTRMLEKDIFTTAGLRTLSSKMGNYDPFSYHNGSIWPFDNWFFAEALDKYGFFNEARKVRTTMLKTLKRLGLPYECYTFTNNNVNIRLHKWDGGELLPEKIQAWTLGAIYSFLKKTI